MEALELEETKAVTSEQGITCLGIKLKKEVSVWNLLAICYIYFLMTTIGGYINVQIVYLLRDKALFDLEEGRQGRVMSNILLVAMICGLVFTAIAGYIYDILSRKIPICLAGLIGAGFLVLIPHTAPSLIWLTCVRAAIQMVLVTLSAHPLILDYVKQESRGKAAAL